LQGQSEIGEENVNEFFSFFGGDLQKGREIKSQQDRPQNLPSQAITLTRTLTPSFSGKNFTKNSHNIHHELDLRWHPSSFNPCLSTKISVFFASHKKLKLSHQNRPTINQGKEPKTQMNSRFCLQASLSLCNTQLLEAKNSQQVEEERRKHQRHRLLSKRG
jgi:hypothetical protein